jgi:hypothetical protein
MSLASVIDKVIGLVKTDTDLKGTYFGDQMGISDYPVAVVGAPSLLDEDFPVIAAQTIREERYTVEIVIYDKYEDTEASAKSIITLTDTMRGKLRGDLTLSGYALLGEINDTKFVFGAKSDLLLRISVTTVTYTKRISS